MQNTSNHTWNAGERPPLRITAAGIRALEYFDYVNAHEIVSLAPTDTARPPEDPSPEDRDTEEPEIDLEKAGYDGMGGTPWDAGFEDMDDDDDDYGEHSPEEN